MTTFAFSISFQAVLIETLWNVKYNAKFKGLRKNNRINRNIVECKGRYQSPGAYRIHRINRNIVECKAALKKQCFNPIYVLIETLWNVKY